MSDSTQRIIAVAVLIAGAVALVLISRTGGRNTETSGDPEAPVWAFFAAQRAGDIPAYTDQLTGRALDATEQARQELGDAAFRDYLKKRNGEIKGVAVKGREDAGKGKMTLLVDLVYEDGQEEHRFEVEYASERWRISQVTGGSRHPSPIAYGTPVAPRQEEAGE